MFSNKKKSASGKTPPGMAESSIKAFLGAGSSFEGRMEFGENMRIDGAFKGEVSSKDLLIVGETAELQATVAVGELIVSGRVRGEIKATRRVELRAPARVEGDIEAPAVIIGDGVIFNGTVKMNPVEKRKAIEAQLVALAIG